jgi:hypothetical protein
VESFASVGKVRLFGLVVVREFGRYGLPPTSTLRNCFANYAREACGRS